MKVEPLDFSDEQKPGTLIAAVSVIVKHYGEQGCTTEDVAGTIQKNLPQWNANSASPALSNLVWLGCIRAKSNFGVRRYFHLRDYDIDSDTERLASRRTTTTLEKAKQLLLEEQGRPQVQVQVAAPPQATLAATSKGAMIAIGLGLNRTELVDIQQAREIYTALKAIFG